MERRIYIVTERNEKEDLKKGRAELIWRKRDMKRKGFFFFFCFVLFIFDEEREVTVEVSSVLFSSEQFPIQLTKQYSSLSS